MHGEGVAKEYDYKVRPSYSCFAIKRAVLLTSVCLYPLCSLRCGCNFVYISHRRMNTRMHEVQGFLFWGFCSHDYLIYLQILRHFIHTNCVADKCVECRITSSFSSFICYL